MIVSDRLSYTTTYTQCKGKYDYEDALNDLTIPDGPERHLIIDSMRRIFVPPELMNIAVQTDHDAQTVTFDCPRYWDDRDFSKLAIYINYKRADGKIGCTAATHVIIDPKNNKLMHFNWTITREMSAIKGKFQFSVVMKEAVGNEELIRWNSQLNTEMKVLEGLECEAPDLKTEYPDLVSAILQDVNEAVQTAQGAQDQIDALKDITTGSSVNIVKLTDDISKLQHKTKDLDQVDTELANDIAGLDTRLTAAETSVQSLKVDSNNLHSDIGELRIATNANTSDISGLKQSVSDLQTATHRLNNTTASLEGQVDTIQADVNNTKRDISILSTAIDNVDGNVTAVQDELQKQEILSISNELKNGQLISKLQKGNIELISSPISLHIPEIKTPTFSDEGKVVVAKDNGTFGLQDLSQVMPVADSTTLGGVKAVPAASDMTQAVGVAADGSLKTRPSVQKVSALPAAAEARPDIIYSVRTNNNTELYILE